MERSHAEASLQRSQCSYVHQTLAVGPVHHGLVAAAQARPGCE